MITQAQRVQLVNSGRIFFGSPSHRSDLLDPKKTNDGLIAYLTHLLIGKNHYFGTTAVTSDHPTNDGGPNGRGHNAGCAADGAPKDKNGNWIDASDPRVAQFLRDAAACVENYQIGLVGPSNDPANYYDSPTNMAAAGHTAFHDDGGPHVHLGARKVIHGQFVD